MLCTCEDTHGNYPRVSTSHSHNATHSRFNSFIFSLSAATLDVAGVLVFSCDESPKLPLRCRVNSGVVVDWGTGWGGGGMGIGPVAFTITVVPVVVVLVVAVIIVGVVPDVPSVPLPRRAGVNCMSNEPRDPDALCRTKMDGALDSVGRCGSKKITSSLGVRVNNTCNSTQGVGEGGGTGICDVASTTDAICDGNSAAVNVDADTIGRNLSSGFGSNA